MEFEAEVLDGLAPIAAAEIEDLGVAVSSPRRTALRFDYRGSVHDLLGLRTAVSVYAVQRFPVPRPKALLGEQHLRALVDRIGEVRTLGTFSSFRFSAAGRDSSVFVRLAGDLEQRTGLIHAPGDGELLLRVHPAAAGDGWEVLHRLSPRPLSARPWRVRDRRGALNATIAAAMVRLLAPTRDDRFLNVACGTGTLLVERAAAGPAARLVGVDIDADALDDATANGATGLVRGDAAALPFPPASFGVLAADLPYGTAMGSPAENERLYPALLADAARVAAPGARFAIITHDLRRMESILRASDAWSVTDELQVFQKGHHPKIWLLHRRP